MSRPQIDFLACGNKTTIRNVPMQESSSGAPPLVSVGLAVRNTGETVGRAVRSILAQTYQNWELLVADDGSRDRTLESLMSFGDNRINLVTHSESAGLATRLNELIERSRGKYFARMDGDDFAFPERFSRQVKFLEEHAAVDLVGCGTINFEGEGRIIGKLRVACEHEDICRCPWRGFPLHHPTWMGKTDWFKKNRYDPRLGRAQDFELLLRTHRSSRFSCVFDPMLGYCLERLTLARQFRSRLNVSRTLLRYGLTERDIRFFWGFAEQWLKMALDAAAIGSGLRYRLLRHRALEVSELEKATFQAAWAKLQKMQQGIPCAA